MADARPGGSKKSLPPRWNRSLVKGRNFDYRRSALQQLRERILELPLPDQMEALVVVNNELTERECVDICFSLRPELKESIAAMIPTI